MSRILEAAARAAHEASRALCIAQGDLSQSPWDEVPDWQRESVYEGVRGVLEGDGPRESHARWLAHKTASGWTYGPVKDAEARTHPCMVPYDELPPQQRAKDAAFVLVVTAIVHTLGVA